ncbi:unnamed protein product [Polarella glacialis]|uniref:ribonuclease H n=2 Tax=Polarella glacialis TaxID=89957 RepID=A0A813HHK1_POLGL|nr:unnamed protein product [Polarella glacialis]
MRRVCWHRAAERRADMAGLEGAVDVDATVSLLRTRSCEYVHQGILRNILAGSLAFGHRLFKAGILPDDRCRFCSAGCPETALHMFWECPAWQSERGKHSLAIGSYRSDWPNCFKLCGIMTAEVALLPLSSMSEHSVAALATAPDAHLDHEHPAETLLEGKVVVYTDGACIRNQHKALRRAGCGAFWGPGHIQNWSAPLRGHCQTNQRAELQAVVHVLQHEARDVHIKSDSEYVVKGFLHHRLAWRALGWRKVSHRDLWQALDELVEARLPGAVHMSKVKGHATHRDVKAGRVMFIDKTGNDWADFLATTGAAQHAASEHVVQAAKARLLVGRSVQHMMANIVSQRNTIANAFRARAEKPDGSSGGSGSGSGSSSSNSSRASVLTISSDEDCQLVTGLSPCVLRRTARGRRQVVSCVHHQRPSQERLQLHPVLSPSDVSRMTRAAMIPVSRFTAAHADWVLLPARVLQGRGAPSAVD